MLGLQVNTMVTTLGNARTAANAGDGWRAAELFAQAATQSPGMIGSLRQVRNLGLAVTGFGPQQLGDFLTNCFGRRHAYPGGAWRSCDRNVPAGRPCLGAKRKRSGCPAGVAVDRRMLRLRGRALACPRRRPGGPHHRRAPVLGRRRRVDRRQVLARQFPRSDRRLAPISLA